MQTFALVLAVCVTALYGYGAQATMAADLARARAAAVRVERADPVRNGGMLEPILVEERRESAALVTQPPACPPARRRG